MRLSGKISRKAGKPGIVTKPPRNRHQEETRTGNNVDTVDMDTNARLQLMQMEELAEKYEIER